MMYKIISKNYWGEENIKFYVSFEKAKESIREVAFYWIEQKYKTIGRDWGDIIFKVEREKKLFEERGEVNTKEFSCKIIFI